MRDKVIALASAEIGYSESPANSNQTKFGKEFGLDGQQWCCIFYMCMLKHAGITLPTGPHHYNQNGYSSVPGLYIDHKDKITQDPKPGDAVIFDWQRGKKPDGDWSADHIGIFKSWIDKTAGTFYTVEGNTSSGNDSNGGQVQMRMRNLAFVQAFLNIIGNHD